MKTFLRFFVPVTALGLLAGCSTIDPLASISNRVQERSAVFTTLTPAQQKTIKEGYVERGFTTDMVYMVLGNPASVRSKDAKLGKLEMWTYDASQAVAPHAKDTRNDPNNPRYTSQTVATVSAEIHTQPGLGGPPDSQGPGQLGATSAAMGSLYLPDLKLARVHLFFVQGRVAEIKFESQDS